MDVYKAEAICPKCGFAAEPHTSYQEPVIVAAKVTEAECLKRVCIKCGYTWKEATKDAKVV